MKRKPIPREQYLKIVRARANLNKLAKKGIVKKEAVKAEIKINRYGEAAPTSRALKKTLSDFHATIEGKAKVYNLTKEQEKRLRERYASLPVNDRPVIKNGRVEVGEGLSFFKKDARIGRKGFTRLSNSFLFGENWQDGIRAFAAAHPGKDFAWEFGGAKHQTVYQHFSGDEYGINAMIMELERYIVAEQWDDDDGFSLLLYDNNLEKRREKHAKAKNAMSKKTRAKKRASKRGMRKERGK